MLRTRLVALLLSTLGCAIAGELWARWLVAGEDYYDIEMWRYAREVKVAVANPDRVFAHRPHASTSLYGVSLRTNELGFRDERELEDTAGERRVLLLGDSMTMGWGVPIEEIFASRLPAMVADTARIRLMNTGVGAYNTVQELATARDVGFALRPEAVLLAWTINDGEPLPRYHPNIWWMHSRLALLGWSRGERLRRTTDPSTVWAAFYHDLYREDAAGFKAMNAAFAALGQECRERNLPGLVALLPELHELGPNYPFAAVHEHVMGVARAAGFDVVDTREAFPAGDGHAFWVSDEDAHPNGRAHALIAEAIAPRLRALLQPPPSP